ncbi:hypothetical protein OESDEN_20233 [Oesophagostomum dentatum]|uniref:Uncharacterized protein n=1 Tax=Oesophagostomum dentatum TaxID=61180 RepID=A0A0B1SA62_OESDE|nr:hypothetical protein OESDEN_20233 [Oesophagostomum dentatum]
MTLQLHSGEHDILSWDESHEIYFNSETDEGDLNLGRFKTDQDYEEEYNVVLPQS